MTLKFIQDKEYDLEMIPSFLSGRPETEIKIYSRLMGIDFDFGEKIAGGDYDKMKLKNIVDERYEKSDKYLTKTIKLYQDAWDEIDKEFFNILTERTESNSKFEEYQCVVSLFLQGISNYGGNKIVRGWKENPYTARKITAHELVIAHLWNILEKKNVDDTKRWGICEVYAWCILGLDKEMIEFWPWESSTQLFPKEHNHPQLYELQSIGEENYSKKKFGELIDALAEFKK